MPEVAQLKHATLSKELRDAPENSITQVTLREELTELPIELLRHAASINFLDVSNNRLESLPPWIKDFTKLQTFFASFNAFREVPPQLASVTSLHMLGMRGNQIVELSESTLPPSVCWLTLTDNKLTKVPASISRCRNLQKLLLAGNNLSSLPETLASCTKLELLRISANQMSCIPKWITTHPALAWLAIAGNPFSQRTHSPRSEDTTSSTDWSELTLLNEIGRGASGITYRGIKGSAGTGTAEEGEEVAIKVFNSPISSDGSATDEIHAALVARSHPNLLTPTSQFVGHPEGKQGLIYPLLGKEYFPIASPPNFTSITRDVYRSTTTFTPEQALNYISGISAAMAHLHNRKLLHGDLYGHNTLIDGQNVVVSDFGATVNLEAIDEAERNSLLHLECRALGILLQEIADRVTEPATCEATRGKILSIANALTQPAPSMRPTAEWVLNQIAL